MSAPATDPQQQDQKNIRDYLADLNNAYNTVKTRPCKVGFVKIDGLERTKTTLVERELERVFDADTLEEVNQRLMEAYGDLMAMDVFEGVQIIADQSDKVCCCFCPHEAALLLRSIGVRTWNDWNKNCIPR